MNFNEKFPIQRPEFAWAYVWDIHECKESGEIRKVMGIADVDPETDFPVQTLDDDGTITIYRHLRPLTHEERLGRNGNDNVFIERDGSYLVVRNRPTADIHSTNAMEPVSISIPEKKPKNINFTI